MSESDEIKKLAREVVRVRKMFIEQSAHTRQLADFIISEVPGEPSQNESAVECIIRVMRERQEWEDGIARLLPDCFDDDVDQRTGIEQAVKRLVQHWESCD